MPRLQIKIIYKSSTFYYCSNEICHSSLYQKALMEGCFVFRLFSLFWGVGEGGEGVLGTKLYFCHISYTDNDITDKLILFSHSKRTLTLLFK